MKTYLSKESLKIIIDCFHKIEYYSSERLMEKVAELSIYLMIPLISIYEVIIPLVDSEITRNILINKLERLRGD